MDVPVGNYWLINPDRGVTLRSLTFQQSFHPDERRASCYVQPTLYDLFCIYLVPISKVHSVHKTILSCETFFFYISQANGVWEMGKTTTKRWRGVTPYTNINEESNVGYSSKIFDGQCQKFQPFVRVRVYGCLSVISWYFINTCLWLLWVYCVAKQSYVQSNLF